MSDSDPASSTGAVLKVIGLVTITVVLGVVILGVELLELGRLDAVRDLAELSREDIEAPPTLLWAHRGAPTAGVKANSPQAVALAAARGFVGVEIDVRWRAGKLIAAHDKHERGVPLADVLAAAPRMRWLWIDFKALNPEVARMASAPLRELLNKTPHLRTYVESNDPVALAVLANDVGVRTLLRPSGWQRFRLGWGYLGFLRSLHEHRIDAVSWPARSVGTHTAQDLQAVGLFVWTVNDAEELKRLVDWDVDVALTDELTP